VRAKITTIGFTAGDLLWQFEQLLFDFLGPCHAPNVRSCCTLAKWGLRPDAAEYAIDMVNLSNHPTTFCRRVFAVTPKTLEKNVFSRSPLSC